MCRTNYIFLIQPCTVIYCCYIIFYFFYYLDDKCRWCKYCILIVWKTIGSCFKSETLGLLQRQHYFLYLPTWSTIRSNTDDLKRCKCDGDPTSLHLNYAIDLNKYCDFKQERIFSHGSTTEGVVILDYNNHRQCFVVKNETVFFTFGTKEFNNLCWSVLLIFCQRFFSYCYISITVLLLLGISIWISV